MTAQMTARPSEEVQFAIGLSEPVINRVTAIAFSRCARFTGTQFGYSWEDVAQQVLLQLWVQCQEGRLFQKISNKYIALKVLDAIRTLQDGRKERPPLVLFSPLGDFDDSHVQDWGFEDAHREITLERAAPVDADDPEPEEVLAAGSLAELVRTRFERSGGLWSQDFHNWLDNVLVGLQGEASAALDQAEEAKEKSLVAVGIREVHTGSVAQRLLNWVGLNEGRGINHVELAEEIGARRETVSKNLKKLVDAGQVISRNITREETERDQGHRRIVRSYFLPKEKETGV